MNQTNNEKLHLLLKKALPPVADAELQRDLWPLMLRRLEAPRPLRVPWFDWALAVAPPVGLAFFPEMIPVLLYFL